MSAMSIHLFYPIICFVCYKVYEFSPKTWDQCGAWLALSWDFIKDYSHWIWKHILHLSGTAHHWIQHNMLTSVHQ